MKTNRKIMSILKRQAGISNIQIMIVVLIGAIMVMGGVGMLRLVDQAKVDGDLRDLVDYKQKTVNFALQHGSFADVTQEDLIKMGFFPTTDVSGPIGSRVISSRWKGNLTAAGGGFLVAGDTIVYTSSGVSSAGCKLLGMQAGRIADGIMVTGAWVKLTPATSGSNETNEPLLISLCDAGKDNLTIKFFITKY